MAEPGQGSELEVHELLSSHHMISQKHCPFCLTPAQRGCSHQALAVEARDFVRRCVESSEAQSQWLAICQERRSHLHLTGEWSPEREDFTWLETAFCDEFLKRLTWFGGMDHEWRTGPKPEQGGFWVLLWSKNPQQLWWELRDEFERQLTAQSASQRPSTTSASPAPWLLVPDPSNASRSSAG